MSWPIHGANPHYLYEQLNLKMPKEAIDFSVNLNPFGPPRLILDNWVDLQKEIVDYPDPLGQQLKEKISKHHQIPDQHILLGNGAAELIQLLAIMLQGKDIAVFHPTFSEYERMCRAYDAKISQVHTSTLKNITHLEEITSKHDALFLCHPNNPTGEVYPQATITKLINMCEENSCYLILDEAFYDFVIEDISFVSKLKNYRYLIILHSLTKMYAIAGVRLGICFASEYVVQKLRQYQPYWSVNGIALKIGELLFDEKAYVKETTRFMAKQKEIFFPQFQALNYKLSHSVVNYFLLKDCQIDNQKPFLIFLLKQGIIPRHTMNYPFLNGEYLRFSIRKTADMKKLVEVLKLWRDK